MGATLTALACPRRRMGLAGSDRFDPRAWIADLTYKEIHATAAAVIHAAVILAAHRLGYPSVTIGAVVFAGWLLGFVKSEATRDLPVVQQALDVTPDWLIAQIRSEPHYYGVPLVVAVVVGYALLTVAL